MKKIALGVVLLILAGVLVAPKLIGDKAHQEYLKSFAEYPTGTSGVSFESKSYEQSWFTSRAITVMKIPLGSPEIKEVSVVLTSHIVHGPVVFTDNGPALGLAYVKSNITLAELPAAVQKLADQYLPAGTVTTASLIDFNQISHDVMHVGSISFKDEKSNAVFGGLNITGVSKQDYSSVKGEFKLPASHLVADNIEVNIADASGSYDLQKHRDLMMLGKTDLNFPQIKFVVMHNAVTLEDFRMASNAAEQSGKLNMAASVGVRKITAPVPVTAFQYDIEVNQIDDKAIELWGEITKDMQARATDPGMALNNPKLNQFLELLLQKGLELKQKFTLDGMGGRLNIDWDARFAGLPEGVHIDAMTDKTQLLNAVDMHVLVNVDEKALMATPLAVMAVPYMQKGMLVKQGEKLVADIKLSAGVLTVNGNPVPMGIAGLNGAAPK
jgi:uncharacterized protein YdgA (DUF945 family)